MSIIDTIRTKIGYKILRPALCECGHPVIDHEQVLMIGRRCKWKHCTCSGASPELAKGIAGVRGAMAVLDMLGGR